MCASMKRIYLMVGMLIIIMMIASACSSGSQAKSNPGSTSAASAVSTQPSSRTAPKDGNYSVRIGFPASVRDSIAPDGPDLWALQQGLFEKEFGADGIKVQYVPFIGAAPAINEALAAGSLEMSVIADIGALIGKAGGLKTSLVATGNPEGTSWWLLVSPFSGIKKVADLKGKKVATVKGTLPHFYLLQALKANGLQESDINLINMTMPDSQQALRSGQIDATVMGSWTGAQFLSQGFVAIDSTKETQIGRGTMVIVATDSFIAAHPSFFPSFYKVRQQAADWANANRDAAIDALAKADGGIDRSLEEPLYASPFNFDQSLSPDILVRIKAGENFLTSMGLTKASVDVDAWVNRSVAYQKP